jgi:predicted NACHT family NTPase
MSEQIYDWKRFWCPRSGHISLEDRGYLLDPESKWGHHHNPDLVSSEAIADIPCLALLGEPGIGKSQAMEDLKKHTKKAIAGNHKIVELNLHSYSSEDRLIHKLFESATFTDWINGTHRLYVFLDSLDEGLLRIETLAALLVEEFGEYYDKLDRLYLRLACRTAVFPNFLEDGLKRLWGQNFLEIYELAPLRRVDVMLAVNDNGLNANAFLEEVERKGVVAFAIKPTTLRFLLNVYRNNKGQFPPNQGLVEFYLDGCRSLCEEEGQSRRASGRVGNLEVDQRLIIAARIAAATVFANRFAIWTEPDQGDVPDEDICIRELCWGSENANGKDLPVSESAVREVLVDTGLFSSRGSGRMGWAHQTYAEFLAAWYLKQHQLKFPQILDLIIHPDRRVIPQLHETTAWLVSMMPEVFHEVVQTDPDVLLQSDIATADDTEKEKLVESLLKLHNEEKLSYCFRFGRYKHLNHSKLTEQLRSYVCDSTKNVNSRFVAVDIAEECDVRALQNCLADIALDPNQVYEVRETSARAVFHFGDETTKAQLKPLALGNAGDDPNDTLKGYGLRAVWPKHITAEDLLNSLSQPKLKLGGIPAFGGAYQEFVAYEFTQYLQVSDLPVVLSWLEKKKSRGELNYPFNKLFDATVLKAWEHLEETEILKILARLVFLSLKEYEPIEKLKTELENNDQKRHQLIEAIILRISDSEQEPQYLLGSYYSTLTLLERDFPWLLERLQVAESEHIQKIYAKLIRGKLDWRNSNQLSALIVVSQYNSVLKLEFLSDLEPIELDSQRAAQEKINYLELENRSKPRQQKPLLSPTPKQRVLEVLERIESGQPQLWWQLCREMTLTSTHYDITVKPDITDSPGWKEAEEDTKARIIETAKTYIDKGSPETQEWIRTNNFLSSAFAGYQAFHLLQKQQPEFISTVSTDLWTKWIPVILKSIDYFPEDREDNDEYYREILRRAFEIAYDDFINALIIAMKEINYQPRTHYANDVYRLARKSLNESLANSILIKLKKKDLKAGILEVLLEDLFSCKIDEARTLALSFISMPIPKSGEARSKALVAAYMLALNADNFSWPIIWSVVKSDPKFGREFLDSIAREASSGEIEQQLKEEYLADLYILLSKEYPEMNKEEESNTEELSGISFSRLGSVDSVKMWKNYIPQRLSQRGTLEACDALRKIIRELPELRDELQWQLLEAEDLTRRKTWKPPQPGEIFQIASDQGKRLVQNGHQLLDVLIESLKHLELELQGETPAARDLWDKVDDKSFNPVDENAFSDYVKRFLDKDLKSRGVVVNREVELRRNYGGSAGERTDIHVDAVLMKPNGELYDSITVIIEVKGCWHGELNIAMETQLADRYLRDNACQFGLYLVGWFNCSQWNAKDSRKNKAPRISINEAREQFNAQAEGLSLSGNAVRACVLNAALR